MALVLPCASKDGDSLVAMPYNATVAAMTLGLLALERHERAPAQSDGDVLASLFFRTSDDLEPDDVGVDLASENVARQEAIRTAGQILCDSVENIRDDAPWTMRVTDAKGGIVCSLQFSATSNR